MATQAEKDAAKKLADAVATSLIEYAQSIEDNKEVGTATLFDRPFQGHVDALRDNGADLADKAKMFREAIDTKVAGASLTPNQLKGLATAVNTNKSDDVWKEAFPEKNEAAIVAAFQAAGTGQTVAPGATVADATQGEVISPKTGINPNGAGDAEEPKTLDDAKAQITLLRQQLAEQQARAEKAEKELGELKKTGTAPAPAAKPEATRKTAPEPVPAAVSEDAKLEAARGLLKNARSYYDKAEGARTGATPMSPEDKRFNEVAGKTIVDSPEFKQALEAVKGSDTPEDKNLHTQADMARGSLQGWYQDNVFDGMKDGEKGVAEGKKEASKHLDAFRAVMAGKSPAKAEPAAIVERKDEAAETEKANQTRLQLARELYNTASDYADKATAAEKKTPGSPESVQNRAAALTIMGSEQYKKAASDLPAEQKNVALANHALAKSDEVRVWVEQNANKQEDLAAGVNTGVAAIKEYQDGIDGLGAAKAEPKKLTEAQKELHDKFAERLERIAALGDGHYNASDKLTRLNGEKESVTIGTMSGTKVGATHYMKNDSAAVLMKDLLDKAGEFAKDGIEASEITDFDSYIAEKTNAVIKEGGVVKKGTKNTDEGKAEKQAQYGRAIGMIGELMKDSGVGEGAEAKADDPKAANAVVVPEVPERKNAR